MELSINAAMAKEQVSVWFLFCCCFGGWETLRKSLALILVVTTIRNVGLHSSYL